MTAAGDPKLLDFGIAKLLGPPDRRRERGADGLLRASPDSGLREPGAGARRPRHHRQRRLRPGRGAVRAALRPTPLSPEGRDGGPARARDPGARRRRAVHRARARSAAGAPRRPRQRRAQGLAQGPGRALRDGGGARGRRAPLSRRLPGARGRGSARLSHREVPAPPSHGGDGVRGGDLEPRGRTGHRPAPGARGGGGAPARGGPLPGRARAGQLRHLRAARRDRQPARGHARAAAHGDARARIPRPPGRGGAQTTSRSSGSWRMRISAWPRSRAAGWARTWATPRAPSGATARRWPSDRP